MFRKTLNIYYIPVYNYLVAHFLWTNFIFIKKAVQFFSFLSSEQLLAKQETTLTFSL